MSFEVAPIVEGHGDVAALPVLLRRINPSIIVKRPVRFPRNKLVIREHLIRAAEIAAANLTGRGGLLLLLDADEDCAAELGPRLEAQLTEALPQHVCRVVLAVREFEAWIVGGDPAFDVSDPDQCGDLKGRIHHHLGVYSETVDQPRLIAGSNLDRLLQCSRSFQRLHKVVDEFASRSPD